MSTTRSAVPKAPVIRPAGHARGLLICAHGVHGGPGVADEHAAAIRRLGLFAEVRACCLKGRPGLAQAIGAMASAEIFVVPLFMAEGHAFGELLPAALAEAAGGGKSIELCRPVGANPGLAAVMSRAALRTCREHGWAASQTALVVMGHGTLRNPDSGVTALGQAQSLSGAGAFGAVGVAFLDQPPSLEETLARLPTRHAVVVGLFADRGPHGAVDVPLLVARAGTSVAYAGPIGTAAEIPELILDQLFTELAAAS